MFGLLSATSLSSLGPAAVYAPEGGAAAAPAGGTAAPSAASAAPAAGSGSVDKAVVQTSGEDTTEALPDGDGDAPEEFDFPDHDDDLEGEVVAAKPATTRGQQTPPSTTQTPATTPLVKDAPTTKTAPEAAVAATPAATPPVDPKTQTPAADAAAKPPATETSGDTAKTIPELLEAGKDKLLTQLTEQTYKLSDKEVEAIESGDYSVISRLQAKGHFEMLNTVGKMFEAIVPRMIVEGILAHTAQSEADREFYGTFEGLVPHRQKVNDIAKMVREQNPTLPRAEFVQKLGVVASTMLGVPLPAAVATPAAPTSQPTQPAARRQAPHSPVVSSVPTNLVPQGATRPPAGSAEDWAFQDRGFDMETES